MRRPYLLLSGVTAGWGTIPVLAGKVDLPSTLIVGIRLWTAAICLAAVLAAQRWKGRRGGQAARPAAGVGGGLGESGVATGGLGESGGATGGPGAGLGASGGATGGPAGRLTDQVTGSVGLFSIRPLRCALTAVALGCHWLALFAAYKRAPAGTVILIVYLAPIGVAALAPRLLGERLGRRTIGALAAAVAGFALLAAPTVHSAGAAGLILSLIAAVLFVALILLSKSLAPVYGGLRLAFMELAGAGLVLIPIALVTAWPAPKAAWLWVVVLGVVHTALGITLYLSVLAQIPATDVGILGYLEPVVVVLAAWLWLGQRPALATVAGGLLVVAAGVSIAISAPPDGRRRGLDALVGSVDPAVPSP
jgi:drug/metabolite transporter (DMT)-like permease